MQFKDALKANSLKEVRGIPKGDLHNHVMLGGKRSRLEKTIGIRLEKFSVKEGSIRDINGWIAKNYKYLFDRPGTFEKTVEAAFLQARTDGITVLEMSMDVLFGRLFKAEPEKIISTLRICHNRIAPEIEFRPELGMSRSLPVRTIFSCIDPYLDSGFFRSVDLYDDEFAQPVENFRELYRLFRKSGLKCKAHAGEFGDAASVRKAAEVLELDAIQHGIAAASSPEVMKWLAGRKIQLNICPASNIRMKRARSYATHPIRILYDHGVKVTVNSDDVILFNAGVSEQFLRLYRSGLFNEEELDEIRLNGLS
jgi:adenosine deaminase